MGADNQAEKVIAKLEYRDRLAEVFWDACADDMEMVPWAKLSDTRKRAVRAGINAIIRQLDHDVDRVAALTRQR